MNSKLLNAAAGSIIGLILAASACAQEGPPQVSLNPGQLGGVTIYAHEGSVLVLTVYNEKRILLDRQAVVKLTNRGNQNVLWQTTEAGSVATFTELRTGIYDIEVSAVEYLTERQELTVQAVNTTHRVEVTLKKDPSAVDLSVQKNTLIPSKARKDVLRGAAALRSGNLKEAQNRLENAYKSDPSNSEVNFLLGYLYFQKKDFENAQTHLTKSASLDLRNVQALTLLGRMRIQQGDYGAAKTTLEQAVAADPEYWTAHHLLGNSYLRLKEFEKAREQAQLAIERGKGGGNAAQLVLGEALANLGRNQEAIEALQSFLQNAPASPSASQVRDLIVKLERRISQPASSSEATPQAASSLVIGLASRAQTSASLPSADPILAAAEPELSIKTSGPAGIDDVKPMVAVDVSCPYERVIDMAGQRVKEFVDDLSQFEAIEDLVHQDLDELGNPKKSVTLKFDYTASISETQPGRFIVDEFRTGRSGVEDFPDQIATRGLPTLALIFHPDMRGNFAMSCEGLGTWDGKATWLIHFRQREDRPHRIQDYIVANRVYPVSVKGRAWIAADTFQIVRLESELASPIPEIQLLSQHQIVEYGSVPFPKKKVELWLPKGADLYFDFRKHRYFRRHSFDHYMLFSVDTEEKRKEPKQKADQNGPASKVFPRSLKHRRVRA